MAGVLDSLGGLFSGVPNPKGGTDYLGGLLNYSPQGNANLGNLGLIGSTLKDVANGGQTDNISAYQKNMAAQQQEAIRQKIAGKLSAVGVGGQGGQGGGASEDVRPLLMQYVAAGGDPKHFTEAMNFGKTEYSTTPQFTGDGRAFVLGKDGQPKWLDGITPRDKAEIAPSGVAYNPYDVKPGAVFNDPNKPFGVGAGGQIAPNNEYQRWSLEKARAGASNTNINTASETAFAKKIGELQGNRYSDLVTGADGGQREINMLGALESSLAKAPYHGPLAELLTDASKLGGQLGLNTKDTSQAEAARAMSNQFALLLRSPAGGAGMPGAMSDKDREFLINSVPGLKNSPQGAQQLIGIMRKMAERKIAIGGLADAYVQKHGVLDNGFNRDLKDWAEKNPLFTPGQQGASAPVSVQSQNDYDRVPSGAQYMAPDGTTRIKR